MEISAKTLALISVVCAVGAFSYGVYSNDSNTSAASAIANVTEADTIEILEIEIARLNNVNMVRNVYVSQLENAVMEYAYKGQYILLPFTMEQCTKMFTQHYSDYPTYWTGTESIDMNAEEETAHFCHYFMIEYPTQH